MVRLLRGFCGAAAGDDAFDQFISDDAAEDDQADDPEIELCWDSENVDGVVEHAHDGRADDHANDGSFAPTQRTAAEDRSGDGVKLVKFAEASGLMVERRMFPFMFLFSSPPVCCSSTS